MPTRKTMELVVITVVLMAPALSMIKLWFAKHVAVTGSGVTADAARVGAEIL